jgi:AbrB family looped-hinge helix DNA binding protein
MLTAVKITKKGQVTIPKKIREKLKSDVVSFEVEEGKVVVKPIRSVAGSLQKYGRKEISYKEAREKAWDEVIREGYGSKDNRR